MSEISQNGDDGSLGTGDGLDDNEKEPKKKLKSSRNVSEKKRRDKLNIYISELATMVPSCVSSQRKLDKTTVLQKTVSYMKIHNDLTLSFLGNETGLISSFLSSEELGELLDKALNGFLLVLSLNGEFVFISNSIEELLGLKREELIGKKLSEVVHPEDRERIMREVLYQGTNPLPDLYTDAGNGTTSSFAMTANDVSDSFPKNSPSRINLDFRMLVRGKDGEPVGEEDIHCVGFFDHWMKKSSEGKGNVTQDSREKSIASLSSLGNTVDPLYLVGVGVLARPSFTRAVECELNENQFASRHSLDGKFLFIDPKSILITGYLPFEVLGTSMYDYIHHEDLVVYSKAHESLMEYGEGKTECYRIRIKSGQWTWVKTRSYIAFNHWNSKPEIYCSTTNMISAADGATSLNERKAREMEDGDQEKRQSRFSLLRQVPVKFNSTQEANAMVLAKWAADENMIMSSMEQRSAKANPGDEQSSTSFDKLGNSSVSTTNRATLVEVQGNPGNESESRDTNQEETFELPATVEELDNFRQAQRMLQNQLLEKHSILMKAITKQKSQLQEIQRQMILNLQSQMYVDPIKLQETCSGYIERNKDLSERRQEQEQTLDTITRSLEEQMKNADRHYQFQYNKLLDKTESRLKTAGADGETCVQQPTEDFISEQPVAQASFDVFGGSDDQRQQKQQDQRTVLSPLQLVSVDSSLNLQQHAHIEDVQGGTSSLKRSGSIDTNPRGQKVMRGSASSRPPMWQQEISTGTRVDQQPRQQQPAVAPALPPSWQSYITGTDQTGSSQRYGQTFLVSNQRATTVAETTNTLTSPLLASRDISRDTTSCKLNQAIQRQEAIQSQYSLGTMDSPQTFQGGFSPPQFNMDVATRGASTSQTPTGQAGLGQAPSGQSGIGFGIPQLAPISPNFPNQQPIQQEQQQQQQQQQSSQVNASITQSVAQLLTDSSQNQQFMQVLLSVLSALQSQPHVATKLSALLKQVQGNQQEEAVQQMPPVASSQPMQFTAAQMPPAASAPSMQPSAAAHYLLASCSQGQLQNSRQPPAYSASHETVYQQQQQQQQQQLAGFQNQPRPLQQPQPEQQQQRTGLIPYSRRDPSCLGVPRVTSTTTSYSVSLHNQQQRLQQQQQQQQQQKNEQRQLQQQLARNANVMSSLTSSQLPSSSAASMGFMPYGNMPSTSTGNPSGSALELDSSSSKRKTSNTKTDYFSNFSPEELSSMMLDAPPSRMSNNEGASTSSSSNQQEKKLEGEELLYNPLLSQQQQLLQLHQEQRRQLLVKQQEQRLQMFEAQRRDAMVPGQQQQQPVASHRSPSYNTGPGLRAMLSESAQEGTSRQTGDQTVEDTGAAFSSWSQSNDPLGEEEERVLSLLLAESASYDPFLDNIDWGEDTYGGQLNLNPD